METEVDGVSGNVLEEERERSRETLFVPVRVCVGGTVFDLVMVNVSDASLEMEAEWSLVFDAVGGGLFVDEEVSDAVGSSVDEADVERSPVLEAERRSEIDSDGVEVSERCCFVRESLDEAADVDCDNVFV